MARCEASLTDRCKPRGLLTPPDDPDPRYTAADCFSCWATDVPLTDVPHPLGLPGTVQMIAEHERQEKPSETP